jgi:UvrB/uvrC motif
MSATLGRVHAATLPSYPTLNPPQIIHCKAKPLSKRCSSRLHVYSDDEEACDIADQECFSVSLRLQDTKLQLESAVSAENFKIAATLRDQIQNLELTHRSIAVAQTRQENVLFTVGTCLRHRVYGYRGVIVG